MLKSNIYNIDKEFDYSTIKSIIVKPFEKIAKQEALKKKSNILHDVISDSKGNDDPNNVELSTPPSRLLKLKSEIPRNI
ncbi:MAG: hypothetical protein ACJ71K_14190 [Nitrososphaeraceae archaeon]|jgi:hypothetical protein